MHRFCASVQSVHSKLPLVLSRACSKSNHFTAELPRSADVVIIGGGSAGCHALYYLAKRGITAILLDRSKLTSGTTWHTGGLIWRLRPDDVDTELLTRSIRLMNALESESGHNPGFINNGGLFIAHTKERLQEYQRLATIGDILSIENHIMSAAEIHRDVFPLLNPRAFLGGLYSPSDGAVDPAMLCTALTKAASLHNADSRVYENCEVQEIVTASSLLGHRQVTGVRTAHGVIQTNAVVNATGVWGEQTVAGLGLSLPLVAMRHAYVTSEPIDGISGMPNVRDHDASIYYRIQGSSIQMGGYESNPIILESVSSNFSFSLYDLDWSTFEEHIRQSSDLCPALMRAGIKNTVCGPESFTPDHKPLLGPDPRLSGLFHSCGYNSAGMMFGGGCGEQLAHWIAHGRPELNMFSFDVRRFVPKQMADHSWATERSHEAYAKNYSMVFKYDQPLAGRNLIVDSLHEVLVQQGAFMEERQGWERPGFFLKTPVPTLRYDYDGQYGHAKHEAYAYRTHLIGDCKYTHSDHNDIIKEESLICRNNAALFNLSYYSKFFLTGEHAQQAADWVFTADTSHATDNVVYTCALNDGGGVESDLTVTAIESGSGLEHCPKFEGPGFYIVAGGASGYYTFSHIVHALRERDLNVNLNDVTDRLGVLSIQGPLSRTILQQVTEYDLNDTHFPLYSSALISIRTASGPVEVRAMRISFVGELGYELHVATDKCVDLYKALKQAGATFGLSDAGFRALYALSNEKGYHLWNSDLRMDDTPLEANLSFVCRPHGEYKGKTAIERQRKEGPTKRLVTLDLEKPMQLWGLEGVYRDGVAVGHIRLAEYAYTLDTMLGRAYIQHPMGQPITTEYLAAGRYEIDVMGERHPAKLILGRLFDPDNKRLNGVY